MKNIWKQVVFKQNELKDMGVLRNKWVLLINARVEWSAWGGCYLGSTVNFRDLDHVIKIIIFESILSTSEASSIFETAVAVQKLAQA